MGQEGFENYLFDSPIIPKVGEKSSIGFFHDQAQIGSTMSYADSAVLFDLPRASLLSIAQFKHANLKITHMVPLT